MRNLENMSSNLYKVFGLALVFFGLVSCQSSESSSKSGGLYPVPDTSTIPDNEYGELVRYGRDLIVRTNYYLGPEGRVGAYLGNRMTCGNCHLDAGTRPYGLNFYETYARYPQYRAREDRILSLMERINNCVERPHSGRPLPMDSREILAISSYIQWIGQHHIPGTPAKGFGALPLELPDRAADLDKGAMVYVQHCQVCHGADGEGLMDLEGKDYVYPPLWGMNAYQSGSSMHRVLMAAAFIKANMPHETAYWDKPVLRDEEALDVAAFINAWDKPRPSADARHPSYPNPATKPIDYDQGPYVDSFSEAQHKYGPFGPIRAEQQRRYRSEQGR